MNVLLVKKLQKIGIIIISLMSVIGLVTGYIMSKNWVYRYKSELDQFFGEFSPYNPFKPSTFRLVLTEWNIKTYIILITLCAKYTFGFNDTLDLLKKLYSNREL